MDFTVQNVVIELTMPDDSIVNFDLEAPNGSAGYHFGFREFPLIEDYRNSSKIWMPGVHRYQFFARFAYEAHEMDLRYLLASKNIRLKFPPKYGSPDDFQVADCLLSNREAVKNYLAGFPLASLTGDAMPSGNLNLNFEGVNPFNKAEVMEFKFLQSQFPDPFVAPDLSIYFGQFRGTVSKFQVDHVAGTSELLLSKHHDVLQRSTSYAACMYVDKFGFPYGITASDGPMVRLDPDTLDILNQVGGTNEFQNNIKGGLVWFNDYTVITCPRDSSPFSEVPFLKFNYEDFTDLIASPFNTKSDGQLARGNVVIVATSNSRGFFTFNRDDWSIIDGQSHIFSNSARYCVPQKDYTLVVGAAGSWSQGEIAKIGHDGNLISVKSLDDDPSITYQLGSNGTGAAYADGKHFAWYNDTQKYAVKINSETFQEIWRVSMAFTGGVGANKVWVYPNDLMVLQYTSINRVFDPNGAQIAQLSVGSSTGGLGKSYEGWQTELWGL